MADESINTQKAKSCIWMQNLENLEKELNLEYLEGEDDGSIGFLESSSIRD